MEDSHKISMHDESSVNSAFMGSSSNFLKPRASTDPRKETFYEMLYYNVFPHLTFFSFSVLFGIALTILYIVQLALCGVRMEGQFLEANMVSITESLLAEIELLLQHGNLYRTLTFAFIHASLPSLFGSLIMLIVWVSGIEYRLGFVRTMIVFLLCSIAGCTFGAAFAEPGEPIMGASTGIFGILGTSLGSIILNWNRLGKSTQPRLVMFWFVLVIMVVSYIFSQSILAFMLQLGGVIAGLLIGMALSPFVTINSVSSEASIYELIIIITGFVTYAAFLITSVFMMKANTNKG